MPLNKEFFLHYNITVYHFSLYIMRINSPSLFKPEKSFYSIIKTNFYPNLLLTTIKYFS